MSLNHLVLALNSAYEPCNIISARRALTLVLGMGPEGVKAVVEKASNHFVRVGAVPFAIPSVIRFLKYRRTPRMNRSVSRKSILLRDRLTCQYCLRGFSARELTLDHVIPRSRSGPTHGEPRLGLLCLQQQEGRSHAHRGWHAPRAEACSDRDPRETPADDRHGGFRLGRVPVRLKGSTCCQ